MILSRPLSCDIELDRDMEMRLRDGTCIYLDVYRSVSDEPFPALLAWSPYGKQVGHQEYDIWPARAGVAPSAVSGLPKPSWEGQDPAFWCVNGYAVVNVDPRGAFPSEGDVQWMSPLGAQDGYDVVEWVAAQGLVCRRRDDDRQLLASGDAVGSLPLAPASGCHRAMGKFHRPLPGLRPARR